VDTWEHVNLDPEADDSIEDYEGPNISDAYDDITDLLEAGDIFAVIAEPSNAEGVDYYLLQCTTGKNVLDKDTVDDFDSTYSRGDMVVVGTYFVQTVDPRATRVLIFERYEHHKTCIHFSHLVIGVKIKLKNKRCKGGRRFHLSIEEHERLLEIVRSRT
jgi:hypothetical protein